MGKKSKPPPAPDYTALAEKTAISNKEAADAATLADRPNQVNAAGDTSSWSKDPTTGAWTQTQKLGATGQAQLDANNALVTGAQGRTADALSGTVGDDGTFRQFSDYDYDKLQGVDADSLKSGAGLFNLDPAGNSKAIQDATYGLLAPQRKMASDSEIQRLKSQGLTEDSPAFQRAMLRQGQADTDAQLKSLLAGQTEYGNMFNRAMGQNQQNFGQKSDAEKFALALRGQQFGEQTADIDRDASTRAQQYQENQYERSQPLSELQTLLGNNALSTPQFGGFAGATSAGGTDYTGAAKGNYDAAVGATNAANQGKANTTSGLVSLAGTAGMMVMI